MLSKSAKHLNAATLTFGFALAFASPVGGQTVSGSGTRPCDALNFSITRDSNSATDSFLSWAQGFISGFNAANQQGIDIAIDHAGLLHWLAGYCEVNPDTPIYEALLEIIGKASR